MLLLKKDFLSMELLACVHTYLWWWFKSKYSGAFSRQSDQFLRDLNTLLQRFTIWITEILFPTYEILFFGFEIAFVGERQFSTWCGIRWVFLGIKRKVFYSFRWPPCFNFGEKLPQGWLAYTIRLQWTCGPIILWESLVEKGSPTAFSRDDQAIFTVYCKAFQIPSTLSTIQKALGSRGGVVSDFVREN